MWSKRESGACVPLPHRIYLCLHPLTEQGNIDGSSRERRTVPVLARFRQEIGCFNDFVDREKRMLTGASNFQEARVFESSGNSEQKLISMN